MGSSAGIGPNGSPPEVAVEPGQTTTRLPSATSCSRARSGSELQELGLVDPDDLRRARVREQLGRRVDRDRRPAEPGVAHDVAGV